MALFQSMLLGMIVFLLITIVVLWIKNSKLKEESHRIKEILKFKDNTIQNLETSRLNVKEVLEDILRMEEVVKRVEAGESKRIIADSFNIPLSKIEFIIKLDLKKRN